MRTLEDCVTGKAGDPAQQKRGSAVLSEWDRGATHREIPKSVEMVVDSGVNRSPEVERSKQGMRLRARGGQRGQIRKGEKASWVIRGKDNRWRCPLITGPSACMGAPQTN